MRTLILLVSLLSVCFAQTAQTISFVDPHGIKLAATLYSTGDPNAPYNVKLSPLAVGATNQQWIVTDPDGFITSVAQPGYALDVYNYAAVSGTPVDIWNKKTAGSTSANQQWSVNAGGSISSYLSSGGNQLYLAPSFAADGSDSGTLIISSTPQPVTISPPPVTPQVCSSVGDPHVSPFTTSALPLYSPGIQAPGDYVLASMGNTRVVEGQAPCGAGNAYCNYNLSVTYNGDAASAVVVKGDTVTIGGNPVTVTGTVTVGQISITRTGTGSYTINVPEGYITVKPNGTPGYPGIQDIQVVVNAAPAPYGGLCGSYTGPNGSRKRAITLAEFIQSWKVLFEDDPFDYASYEQWLIANPSAFNSTLGNVTTTNQVLLNQANTLCAPLQSGSLVDQCSSILDPTPYYQACHDDVILTAAPGFAASIINAYSFKCSKTNPPGAPAIILPSSPLNTIAFGPGVAKNVDQGSAPVNFTIEARNALDEDVGSGGDSFTISSVGPSTLTFTTTDLHNGFYVVTYIPSTIGSYAISIAEGANQIVSSPFSVTVNAVVTDPTKSTASGPGLGPNVVAGSTQTITVVARTSSGAQRTSSNDQVTATYTGFVLSPSVTNNGDGTFTIRYQQVQVGSFTVTIKINNVNIQGSPFTVNAQ